MVGPREIHSRRRHNVARARDFADSDCCYAGASTHAARADLLQALRQGYFLPGENRVSHRWKHASILESAWRHQVPCSVHPGIGYDIIANHPIFNGAVIGRGAELDFKLFGGAVENLDGGVVLSVGSAIMDHKCSRKPSVA